MRIPQPLRGAGGAARLALARVASTRRSRRRAATRRRRAAAGGMRRRHHLRRGSDCTRRQSAGAARGEVARFRPAAAGSFADRDAFRSRASVAGRARGTPEPREPPSGEASHVDRARPPSQSTPELSAESHARGSARPSRPSRRGRTRPNKKKKVEATKKGRDARRRRKPPRQVPASQGAREAPTHPFEEAAP